MPKLCQDPLEAAHHLMVQNIEFKGVVKQRWEWLRDLVSEMSCDSIVESAGSIFQRHNAGTAGQEADQASLEAAVEGCPVDAMFNQILMPILKPADIQARMVCKQSQVNVAPVVEVVIDPTKQFLFGSGCRRPNRKEPLAYLLERTAEVPVGDPSTSCLVFDAPQATDRKQSPDAVGASIYIYI